MISVPGLVIAVAGTVAVECEDQTKLVARVVSFQSIVDSEAKPVPLPSA
jgi:hypothetical protein